MGSFEELVSASFQIIASVGAARSCYIDAIRHAQRGAYDEAQRSIEEAGKLYAHGHAAHLELVRREAAGAPTAMCLMLTHAEDQLMSAEGFGILAEEFISVYRTIDKATVSA